MMGKFGVRKNKIAKVAAILAAMGCSWGMPVEARPLYLDKYLGRFNWNNRYDYAEPILTGPFSKIVVHLEAFEPYNEPESGGKVAEKFVVKPLNRYGLYALEVVFADGYQIYTIYENRPEDERIFDHTRTRVAEGPEAKIKFIRTDKLCITSERAQYSQWTPNVIYTVNYSLGTSSCDYLFDDAGITWKAGADLVKLNEKFDFGYTALSTDLNSLKIKNPEDLVEWTRMNLVNDSGYYDYTTFYDKVKPSLFKTTNYEYTCHPTASITASGVAKMGTGITTSNGNNLLKLTVHKNTLKTLDVDLAKIGNGGDAWNPKENEALYTWPQTETFSFPDYSLEPLTVTVKDGAIAGGTTDETYKAGATMTLLNFWGSYTNQIVTKYDDGYEVVTVPDSGMNMNAVSYTDTSAGGVTVSGTHSDTLRVEKKGNNRYYLKYIIGNKKIYGVGSSASGIDLSNTAGGFVADSGYTIGKEITLDLGSTTFTNTLQAGNYTLLDLTGATWESDGKLSVKKDGTTSSSASIVSDEYTVVPETNGVTAFGTKEITFKVDDSGKKIDVSASEGKVSKIQLGAYDVTKSDAAPTIGNLAENGTIDDSKFSLTGISTLADAAKYTSALTLAKAKDGETYDFSNWTGHTTDEKKYTVYDKDGITGTMAGTLDTTDGNINLKTDGLKSISYGTIDDGSKAAVTLAGGKLGSVDFSNLAFSKAETGTVRLLDAQNLSDDVRLETGDKWTENTQVIGNTTTYHSAWTKEDESVTAAGMTLSLNRADQLAATKTETAGKYNLAVDYTTNQGFATEFSIGNGITWTKDGEGLKLTEHYDFSTLADGAISFDASNPYALIANPDQVGLNETMTFFNAGTYMTDEEWNSKVKITNATGGSTPYTEQHGAVTAEGQVELKVEKDNTAHTVTGTISDEYLSGVAIDLSKIGNEEATDQSKWENRKTLYSQTASTQDYGDGTKTTSVNVSGNLFGGTTDESVKTGESVTLLHIAGKNAGVSGNLKIYDNEKKTVAFSDKAQNGITATGSHEDTLQSSVSGNEGQGTYKLTYTVGKKTVTGLSVASLDLDQGAFVAGDQYTLGEGNENFELNVKYLVIGATENTTTQKTIIDFTGDTTSARKFSLSNGEGEAGSSVTSAISYIETDADAVNGVRAAGNQNRKFSTDGKSVYLDSITEETNKVIIGEVDLSKDVRSFSNLTETGTIDVGGAKYSANKKISDVAGQTIKVVGATGTNTFRNWTRTGEVQGTQFISVNQETGISAVVKATYDVSDGNLNLNTKGLPSPGMESLTFGKGIEWRAGATAVSLSGQGIETLDFSEISFADTDKKKNETMHLLIAKDMPELAQGRTMPSDTWTERVDGETTYYNKNNRTHDETDDLTGNGITISVDRGDQMVLTAEALEGGKRNYTLDYTRGKGYVTGMTIAEAGITWENGKTAIKLAEDYDFSGATLTFPANQIANASTLKTGDAMTLFDANGHMSDTDWTNVVKINPQSDTVGAYTNQATKAIAISGNIDVNFSKDDTKKQVIGNVSDQCMNTIAIDLSKIGEASDETDAWSAGTTLYTNATSAQDYATKKVSVSVGDTGKIFGGTTDESVKAGETMTLLDITGTNAGGAGNISAIDQTSAVAFKDKQENGLTVTGTHTDTIESQVSSADATTGNYKLLYTVGKKELNADSEIGAAALDMTKDAFKAGDQYTLSGNVTIDVRNISIKHIGDGTKKAFIDFAGDSGSGKFTLKDDDEEGDRAYNVGSYTEEEDTNGIWAAGNQYRTFTTDGKTVYLDSVTQDVNEVTVGMVDFSKPIRSLDNLTEEGTVSTMGFAILDNLSLTEDEGKNFTLAKATGTNNFSKWTLPEGEEDVYVRQETGVVGIMKGEYNTESGQLNVEMKGVEGIYFYEGVKWREGSAVLDFAGTGVDFTGKEIDASKISFDTESVASLSQTDRMYRMVLINTDAANHLDKADITNNDNIDMTIADTLKFQGQTKLSADKLQFVADMWRGTGTATDAAHRHVMAQAAAMQAIVTGNVETTDSISGALSHFRADDVKGNSMTFARVGGSSTTTQTGSHISENLWNVNVGVATRKDSADGAHSEYGLYYEGGTGNYSTHDAGEGVAPTSGDLTHHGVGFLFRRENKNAVYGEAGLHVGRISNENSVLGLDNSATYYGLHLGVGKIIRTSDKDSWDLYTKFYWNRTGGMDYRNSAVTDIHLDAVTSKLLRIGGRYRHEVEKNWSFYTGAALSYEFGGAVDGTAGIVNGDSAAIRTATIKGAGAVLELGFRKEAAKGNPWEIDLGIKGYLGRQTGFGGNIGINYHF